MKSLKELFWEKGILVHDWLANSSDAYPIKKNYEDPEEDIKKLLTIKS